MHPDLNQGLAAVSHDGRRRELRLHDGAGDGGGAGERVQGARRIPASVDTIPTDGSKEDVVPMAMGAAWKLRRVVRNVQHVLAHRADVRRAGRRLPRPLRAARAVEDARHAQCVSSCRRSTQDRVLAPDIAALADAVAAGRFTEVAMVVA